MRNDVKSRPISHGYSLLDHMLDPFAVNSQDGGEEEGPVLCADVGDTPTSLVLLFGADNSDVLQRPVGWIEVRVS
jgi:hypothetical protein